jgi:O-Antigen ligase
MSQAKQFLGSLPAQTASLPKVAFGRLEFALACAVVFLAPMNVLRLESFYFTASDAFACLCLIAMMVNATVKPNSLGPGSAYWIVGLVIMVGALFTSSLLAGAVDRGLILVMQYLFAYFCLPLILLSRPWHETDILMKVFVASMVTMIVHGIYVVEYLGEINTTYVSGAGRLQGFVERENECGSLIALTVPMVLSMAATRVLNPIVALAVVVLLGYGIMLTGSNTALYGMLFGLGVFALVSLSPKRALLGLGCVLLLWAAIGIPAIRELLPAVFQKRVLVVLDSGNINDAGTFSDRVLLIREAFRFAGNALLVGYGADQYREISVWRVPVHNLYLLIWNEGGLFCLAGFLIMLTGAAITIAVAWRHRDSRAEAVSGFSTLTLFAILVNAVPHVYGRFWAVPVILSLAPAITFLRHGPRNQRMMRRTRRG